MLCVIQRVRLLKTTFDLPAIRCLALAVLLCCGVQETKTAAAQGNFAKPTPRSTPAQGNIAPPNPSPPRRPRARNTRFDTYITWLDNQTIILALRNPSTKRIVVGIAKPFQTEAGSENINNIPGFNEIVSGTELDDFRSALAGGPRNKYRIIRIDTSNGPSVSFDQIDQRFRDYIHASTTKFGDLEVWDTLPETTRVVFLGDLVLVKPAQVTTPQSRAEDAMFQLLTKMALDEKKDIRVVSLKGGCAGTASLLETVRQGTFNEESRKALRDVVTGKLIGAQGEAEHEYVVTNSGWVNRVLHLEVTNPDSAADLSVTAVVGEKEESILGQRDVELPPCEVARISIESKRWYYEMSGPVDFRYAESESTLSMVAPAPGINWFLIFFGLAITSSAALLIFLFLMARQRNRNPSRSWSEIIAPGLADLQYFPSDAENPRRAKQLKDNSSRKADSTPGPTIPRLDSLETSDQTNTKLIELQHQLEAARDEHTYWRKSLKELGDSPDAILKSWHDLNKKHQVSREKAFLIAAPEVDERIFRARLISRGITKAGEQLRDIEKIDSRYATLFTGTGLELIALGADLRAAGRTSETTLTFELTKLVRLLNRELTEPEKINQVLRTFLRHLLSDKYVALLGMLRLWQVIEIYCCDSVDTAAAALHTHSEQYRRNCVQILSDFESLGVRFHQIRYLRNPRDEGLVFNEAASIPPLQTNANLFAVIRNRLDSNSTSPPWKTVADVAFWGFECDLNASMNCQSELWLWRSLSFL